ncbi:MAG: hypothetical protein Q9Q40_10895 [Acidobacteriota bacterium]|nr:hypothetical protein [Acidobacteriota bacterium]MDQ7086853.1 hypothetical protein [Acidobacteriota bacterium]
MPRILRILPVLVAASLTIASAKAYSDESVGSPVDGDRVSQKIEFYIAADGGPEKEEYYRIEVAVDSDFEEIVASFDSRKSKAGWIFGDLMGVEDVPEKYTPVNYEGIHFRSRGRLRDGEYYWRASKAVGGGPWEPLDGSGYFIVDTLPPAPVDTLVLAINERGELELRWDAVDLDVEERYDDVAGYRVYQYTRKLKRYPVMTRYLIGETEYTELTVPDIREDTRRIVFYRVRAVDRVGNEEGRRRPAVIGSLDAQLNPPNLDQLADPTYLRRLYQEEMGR